MVTAVQNVPVQPVVDVNLSVIQLHFELGAGHTAYDSDPIGLPDIPPFRSALTAS